MLRRIFGIFLTLVLTAITIHAETPIDLPVIFDASKKASRSKTLFFRLNPEEHSLWAYAEPILNEDTGESFLEARGGAEGEWVYKGKSKRGVRVRPLQVITRFHKVPMGMFDWTLGYANTEGYRIKDIIRLNTIENRRTRWHSAFATVGHLPETVKNGTEACMILVVKAGRRLGRVILPAIRFQLIP